MVNKSIKAFQTKLELEYAYNQVKEIMGNFKKTDFGTVIDKKKQNICGRMAYHGKLLYDEASLLLKFLKEEGKTDNDFFKELYQAINPINSSNSLNDVRLSDNGDFVELNVRGNVGISCGYGTSVYNDGITGKCRVPYQTLRDYGANISSTEVVYAQGDSMTPEIKSGDALLVDTSQRDIIDGVIYAFNYDGQPMCKRLQKIGKKIKAISSNPLYEPFIVDFTYQFNIVGRVVGFMRPLL